MRQNGTNGVIPTRRIVLGGGLAAALWRLGARARADAPAPAAERHSQLRSRAVATSTRSRPPLNRRRLTPMPAQFRGLSSGSGKGEELRLKFANKLAEPTTLSFPGLRAANAARRNRQASRKKGSNPTRARRSASSPPIPALICTCRAPARATSPSRRVGYSARSSSTSRGRRMSTSTRRWCCPTGTSTRAARSRTISPILPSAGEAGARAASFSRTTGPRR